MDTRCNAPVGVICRSCYSKKKLKNNLKTALKNKFAALFGGLATANDGMKETQEESSESEADSFDSLDVEERTTQKPSRLTQIRKT